MTGDDDTGMRIISYEEAWLATSNISSISTKYGQNYDDDDYDDDDEFDDDAYSSTCAI